MAFVIGKVVKMVGSGIGLGREAYIHHKETRDLEKIQKSQRAVAGSSNDQGIYVEVSDEQARDLVARGEAVEVTREEEQALGKMGQVHIQHDHGYDDDKDDDSDSDDLDSLYSYDDEEDWALDEAAAPPEYEEYDSQNANAQNPSISTLVREVMPNPTPGQQEQPRIPLPYPVILPQRRPGTKRRGFIRAYAPDLAACGIDQDTFLRFLKNFHKSSQGSPVFTVLLIAAGIAGLAPSVIAIAVTTAVQFAAKTAQEVQARYRTNNFLDEVNKDLFMPRGLYAMIVKWSPEQHQNLPDGAYMAEIGMENVDLLTAKAITKYMPDGSAAPATTTNDRLRSYGRRFRVASGSSVGESAMPTACASLIFPGLSEFASATSPTPSSMDSGTNTPNANSAAGPEKRGTKKFIADYFDRRAQASYIAANPSSTLAAQHQAPQFRSRFADPNHAANSGNIVSLVTGGAIQGGVRRRARRQLGKELGGRRGYREARGRDGDGSEEYVDRRRRRETRKGKGPVGMALGGVKKVLHEGVLYLMIVNLPSESEMQEARQVLDGQ